MKILLTNDDGIRAPGIVNMHAALTEAINDAERNSPLAGAEVFAVAPANVQSATGHGVTFHEPLMSQPVRINESPAGADLEGMSGIAVDGRPADCVKVALSAIWPETFGERSLPDLVISGMNAGANCGINVIYSGTVAAAIEAAFLGVPAIAVSLHLGRGRPDFLNAARRGVRTIEKILEADMLSRHACININVPRTELPDAEPLSPTERLALTRIPSAVREHPRHGNAARKSNAAQASPEEAAAVPATEMPPIRVCPMNTHGLIDRYERRE
ncbi:MAG: 5'/3'-nucleotidase SurE, partial [Planctomycetota bacterium]